MNEISIKKNLDRDLVVLSGMADEVELPSRDWESIIKLFNINNRPFPISPIVCSKIVESIKMGRKIIPTFTMYGINYDGFRNKYNYCIKGLEELSAFAELTNEQWQMVDALIKNPYFLLGEDIKRAKAFHFNERSDFLQDMSNNAAGILEHLKVIHPEEFIQSTENNNVEVVIKISPGLLEAI